MEGIFFSFPARKAGETARSSMEKRLHQMLPENAGDPSHWHFEWDLRQRVARAYPEPVERSA